MIQRQWKPVRNVGQRKSKVGVWKGCTRLPWQCIFSNISAAVKCLENPCTFVAYLSQSLACHHKAAALAITGSAAAATQEVWPRTASVAADKTSSASAKCHDAEKGANSLRKVLESWLKKVYRLWPLGCPRAKPCKDKALIKWLLLKSKVINKIARNKSSMIRVEDGLLITEYAFDARSKSAWIWWRLLRF